MVSKNRFLLLQHGTVRSEVEEGRNFWYKRRRLEERLSPARSYFLHAIFIMLVIAATIHDQTGPMRQWNKRWRTTPDLEFVKKFTRPNFRSKEYYTLKMRKLRLFLQAIEQHKCIIINILVFLAVQDSSISDIVGLSVGLSVGAN